MVSSTFSLAGEGLKLNTAEDLSSHIQSLIESKDVTHVDLSGNTFGVPACEALAPILSSKSSTLTSIDLHDIFTSRLLEEIPSALSSLLNALLECDHLHTIDLSDNAFGLNTKDPLVDFLSKHIPLQDLVLNNNGMGPIAGTSIANALTSLAARKAEARKEGKEVPDLESIVCGRNRLENGSMGAWAKMYEAHNSGIKSVKMTQNGIRQEGISHLLRSGLRHCKDLEVLDMQDNTFTVMGAGALSEVVPNWTKLKELGVGDDLLGATGSVKVFEALAKGETKSIEVLRLQYNDINTKGVKSLLQAAKNGMPKLRRIELNGNRFDEEDLGIQALADLLSERKDAEGKEEDPEDFWGLDQLDELEEESSDEEEDEAAEEDDLEERILETADEVEDEPVAQRKDLDVDELVDALKKTAI
jgi:Ran GTPase-activating protein 1